MSYIDAYFDRERDQINIVERVTGERKFVDYPARYVFYYDDPKGKHRSIYGDSVSRFSTKQNKEFKRELADKFLDMGGKIDLILDDRQCVVDMWRDEGFVVVQVADGDF